MGTILYSSAVTRGSLVDISSSSMTITGSYSWLTSTDPVGEVKAIVNGNISQEEIKLLTGPNKAISANLVMTGNKLSFDLKYNLKPEWNQCLQYELGVAKDLPQPFMGNAVMTRIGDNCLVETVTFPDRVYTYNMTFSSFGIKCNISSDKDGHISTCIWERKDVSQTGFYIMESSEGLEKMMKTEFPKLSTDQVEEICSYLAVRVTEKDGVYTMTDYFGNGWERGVTYRMDEEFEEPASEFSPGSSSLVTQVGPGHLRMIIKVKGGNVQVWNGILTQSTMTWSMEGGCTISYRRYPDVFGVWREVSGINKRAPYAAIGVPEDKIKEIVEEMRDVTLTFKGKGIWEYKDNGKVLPIPTLLFRAGEEFAVDMGGFKFTNLFVQTQDGFHASSRHGDALVMTYDCVVGDTFMIHTGMINGQPDTKSVNIFVRV